MNLFLTADTRVGHHNIIGYCDQTYRDVQQMDAAFIDGWSAVVSPRDRVWHLGALAMGRLTETLHVVRRVHGRKRPPHARALQGSRDWPRRSTRCLSLS
jgi:calcineurin-like phosphoesterase family protein